MKIDVMVADASHVMYADEVCEEILISARERGTGIARRTPEYISEKILAGKAVIAIAEDGRFAGFSYIETWGGKQYVANSGLIVAHSFRGIGLAMRIKRRNYEILEANEHRMCLCTGLLYDPAEHIEVMSPAHPELVNLKDGEQKN